MRVTLIWNLDLFDHKMVKHVASKKVRQAPFHFYQFVNEDSIDKP